MVLLMKRMNRVRPIDRKWPIPINPGTKQKNGSYGGKAGAEVVSGILRSNEIGA